MGTQMTDKKKPNVIFLFTDQQRWDTSALYGLSRHTEVGPEMTGAPSSVS